MDFKNELVNLIRKVIKEDVSNLLEVQKEKNYGDFSLPCFFLAKKYKKEPHKIAEELQNQIKLNKYFSKAEAVGPYLNFFINKPLLAEIILTKILKEKEKFGSGKEKKKIMVEFPSPNTNKPLHLGHLRNIFLGESLSRILEKRGNKVIRANLNNDRGVHICQAIVAYKKYGKNKKPDKKSDHFVGDFYVLYNQKIKEEPSLEEEAQQLLNAWEQGHKETKALWSKMTKWALDGFNQTYDQLGIKFNKTYNEHDFYWKGKKIILDGYKQGLFERSEDGSISVDLGPELGRKVLLRKDGTSLYITQDLYLAEQKFKDYKLDKSVYVVGSEQDYHFKVLFRLLALLKSKNTEKNYHLSYGMVYLPEGRMKSREGKIVDADDILSKMLTLSKQELDKRYPSLSEKEKESRAKQIGFGALIFFILKFDPARDINFNPYESLSFEGDTGPYIQYAYARINSILQKVKKGSLRVYGNLLNGDELELVKLLGDYPRIVSGAAENHRPSIISNYLLNLVKRFNDNYKKYSIIKSEDKLKATRLSLAVATSYIIKDGLRLLFIDSPKEM